MRASNKPIMRMSFDQFVTQYQPRKNPYDGTLGMAGCLLDQKDPVQWQYTQDHLGENKVWTVLDGSGDAIITSGASNVSRLGFIITEIPWHEIGQKVCAQTN